MIMRMKIDWLLLLPAAVPALLGIGLALLRRVWASMDPFQLQVTLLSAGAVFLLWLAYGALRPVDGEKQENKESDALST